MNSQAHVYELTIARDYGDFSSQVLQAVSENAELTYVNVTYSSTTPCPAVPSRPFQTTIQIICDYDTQFELIPAAPWTYVVHTGACSALIQAASVHACPLNKDLCKFTLHDSSSRSATYELSSLATDRLTIYEAYGSPNTTTNTSLIFFNICAPVLLPFTTSGDCDSDTAGCLVKTLNTPLPPPEPLGSVGAGLSSGSRPGPLGHESGELSFERLGQQSSLSVEQHPGGLSAGVVLVYRGGSHCSTETYSFRLQLDCDPSCRPPGLCLKHQSGGSEFSLSNPPCGYLIIAGSSAACPTIAGGPLSPGNIVSIVLLSLIAGGFVAYCCVGTIVNVVRGRGGLGALPHHDSWVKFFSYVRGGVLSVVGVFCRVGVDTAPYGGGVGGVGLSGDSGTGLGGGASGEPPEGHYGTL